MNEKEYLLRTIQAIEGKLPSKWNIADITGFKMKFLPRLKAYLLKEERDQVEVAEEIFNEQKSNPVTPTSGD